MPVISNKTKVEAVKNFLKANKIVFEENRNSEVCGVVLPLYIPKFRLCVHVGDDQNFYKAVAKKYYPVFVRDTDTTEFVLEKIQNTIIRRMLLQQKKLINGK